MDLNGLFRESALLAIVHAATESSVFLPLPYAGLNMCGVDELSGCAISHGNNGVYIHRACRTSYDVVVALLRLPWAQNTVVSRIIWEAVSYYRSDVCRRCWPARTTNTYTKTQKLGLPSTRYVRGNRPSPKDAPPIANASTPTCGAIWRCTCICPR
jgi:hypothetical protein